MWSVEYETVRGCEGTVPRLAEVTVECDVGSGEEVESWSVGELEEMEEGKSMLKERKWVSQVREEDSLPGVPGLPAGGLRPL